MKKWIVIALSVVFFSLILWSCSDDNSSEPTDEVPTCSITYPTDSTKYSIGIDIEVQVVTNGDYENILGVEFFMDGFLVGYNENYPYTHNISTNDYTEGPHTIKVVVKHNNGLEAENEVNITLTTANFDEKLYYGGIMGMSQNTLLFLNQSDWIEADQIWNLDYFSNRDNWSWTELDSLAVLDMLQLSFIGDDVGTPEIEGFNGVSINLMGGSIEFMHNLPTVKTPQYYEMVGRYHQFSCGWSDYDGYERNLSDEIVYIIDLAINGTDTIEVLRPKLKLNVSDAFDYNDYGH
ncbi:MAG: Ig-like domain-containing protein [Candidatus Delongbacteria bacterium]|jgi:hypothetical protein|nr:Ig-like domain-containing protein [Candidatus Delongbacteria bacterium]